MGAQGYWYCGHCNFGPMTTANNEHCCMCHNQRDAYATYEDQEMLSMSSWGEAHLTPSKHETDSTMNRSALTYPKSSNSFPTIWDDRYEATSGHGQPAIIRYFANDHIRRCSTLCGAPTKWYCCQCSSFTIVIVFIS